MVKISSSLGHAARLTHLPSFAGLSYRQLYTLFWKTIFLSFTGTAAVLSALAAGASVLFTNDIAGSKPCLLLRGFLGRFYLVVVSPSSSVVLSEIHSLPAGELSWNASNHQ